MATEENKFMQMMKQLKEAQWSDHDNREMVREADLFLNKRDGQWEPQIISKFRGKPRYTFDECNPIVDDVMGEMESMEFSIRVNPNGGMASNETAQQFEGIIRTIENLSSAHTVYNRSGRIMVGTGLDGWRVVQEYRDDDSFQQDLLIKKIPNFQDSVWFDPGAVDPTMKDADFGWVTTSMTYDAYKKMFPKGTGMSVGSEIRQQVYSFKKPHEVVIGEYLFKKTRQRTLIQMTDGSVFEEDDNFEMVKDELFAQGIEVHRTRSRDYDTVYQKLFDGSDWLSDAKETVFCYLPIVPVYGNFRISENKVIYWGIVEKLMDAQRVINYAESRKIEEGALSPRGKYWMTKDQAVSPDVRNTLRTLNTNADPVQFYDHAEGQPLPGFQGSPQSNPGLVETSASAQGFIQRTSGTFDEARGAAPAHRSGEAVQLLQNKSDNPKRKWFSAMEVAIGHTCEILVKAIPKVYDTTQEMVLTGQDGTTDTITIHKKVKDEQTGKIVELNDLSKGLYSIVCKAGPAFHSRQQETVTAINEIAKIDPSIMAIGSDVLLSNIAAPGIAKIAERKRMMMLSQGLIPPTQQTEEEKQLVAQLNEGSGEPSPIEQANLMVAEAQAMDVQSKTQERQRKLDIEEQKLKLKELEMVIKQQSVDQKLQLDQQKAVVEAVTAVTQQMKNQADTLKALSEAMNAEEPQPVIEGQARELAREVGNA